MKRTTTAAHSDLQDHMQQRCWRTFSGRASPKYSYRATSPVTSSHIKWPQADLGVNSDRKEHFRAKRLLDRESIRNNPRKSNTGKWVFLLVALYVVRYDEQNMREGSACEGGLPSKLKKMQSHLKSSNLRRTRAGDVSLLSTVVFSSSCHVSTPRICNFFLLQNTSWRVLLGPEPMFLFKSTSQASFLSPHTSMKKTRLSKSVVDDEFLTNQTRATRSTHFLWHSPTSPLNLEVKFVKYLQEMTSLIPKSAGVSCLCKSITSSLWGGHMVALFSNSFQFLIKKHLCFESCLFWETDWVGHASFTKLNSFSAVWNQGTTNK